MHSDAFFNQFTVARIFFCVWFSIFFLSISRLSSPDFKRGFVLQTLNNIFFKRDVLTLYTLLNIVGHVEYSLFVTFLNTIEKYTRRMAEIRELRGNIMYWKNKYRRSYSSFNCLINRKTIGGREKCENPENWRDVVIRIWTTGRERQELLSGVNVANKKARSAAKANAIWTTDDRSEKRKSIECNLIRNPLEIRSSYFLTFFSNHNSILWNAYNVIL